MASPSCPILTTTVSPFAETTTSISEGPPLLLSNIADLGLQHLLVIEFSPTGLCTCTPDSEGYVEHDCIVGSNDKLDRHPQFLHRVRQAVLPSDGGQADPTDRSSPLLPIDGICMLNLPSPSSPSPELIHALRDTRPRVLHVHCGWDEACDLSHLPLLDSHCLWPIEVLELINVRLIEWAPPSAEYWRRVRVLGLKDCPGLTVPSLPAGRRGELRELTIDVSDAFATVCQLSEVGILPVLEVLRITTGGLDTAGYSVEAVLSVLEGLSCLRVLELTLGPWPGPTRKGVALRELPYHLPPNLEIFKLVGPPGLTPLADPWLALIANQAWLPQLKEFGLRLDRVKELHTPRAGRYPLGNSTRDRSKTAREVQEEELERARERVRRISEVVGRVRPGVRFVDVGE